MTCDEIRPRLLDYQRSRLLDRARDEVRAHLATCPDCTRAAAVEQELSSLLEERLLGDDDVHPRRLDRVERVNRAGELAFEPAHVVHLLDEVGRPEVRLVEDLEAGRGCLASGGSAAVHPQQGRGRPQKATQVRCKGHLAGPGDVQLHALRNRDVVASASLPGAR